MINEQILNSSYSFLLIITARAFKPLIKANVVIVISFETDQLPYNTVSV